MKESIQAEVGEWRREKDCRDIEIDIAKKPKIEEEDWRMVRLPAACNERAYVEKWGDGISYQSPHAGEVGTV